MIIGKRAAPVPLVDVELVRSGTELRRVRATVLPAPDSISEAHKQLQVEFADSSVWPKHLLVRYRWTTINEVNVDRGLYVLFGSGLFMSAVVILSVLRTYQAKLSQFLNDMAAEELTPGVSSAPQGPTGGPAAAKSD